MLINQFASLVGVCWSIWIWNPISLKKVASSCKNLFKGSQRRKTFSAAIYFNTENQDGQLSVRRGVKYSKQVYHHREFHGRNMKLSAFRSENQSEEMPFLRRMTCNVPLIFHLML